MPNEPVPPSVVPETHSGSALENPARTVSFTRRLASLAWKDVRLRTLVILLVLVDLVAVLLHVGYWFTTQGIVRAGWLLDPGFYMKYSGSYAAQYGFILMGATALTASWLLLVHREAVYAGIAVVFLGILANAVFRLHVIMGDWIDETLDLQAIYHRYANYVGEAISFAAIGLVLFIGLLVASTRSSVGHRAVGLLIAATLVALGVFDGALDLAHALRLYSSRWLADLLVVVEEGGELSCLTAALVIVATVAVGRAKLFEPHSPDSRQI